MVALDPWDHLGRRVTPMLAVYATATVVVTVAAGTRCAWYGLTGLLDAEQSPPGPRLMLHTLLVFTSIYRSYLSFFTEFHRSWGIITVFVENRSHVEILTQVWAWGGNPPLAVVLSTRCHAWV